MLTSAEAKLISTLVSPSESHFLVADIRSTKLDLFRVYQRKWSKSGVLLDRMDEQLEEECNGIPMFTIMAKGDTPSKEHRALFEKSTVIRASDDGLEVDHQLLACDKGRFQPSLTIQLSGNETKELREPHLPVTFRVAIPANREYANIRVSAPDQDGFPQGQTFYLVPENRNVRTFNCRLRVVPSVSVTDDQWDLSPIGSRVSVQPGPDPVSRQKDHLILIFDQTCPDADRWLHASGSLDTRRKDAKEGGNFSILNPSASIEDDRDEDPGEFNANIRSGLATGLMESMSDSFRTVDLYGFSDDTDHIAVPPDSEVIAEEPYHVQKGIRFENLATMLTNCPYRSGVDLWDALDEVLLAASRTITNPQKTSILIVGNSPPHFPLTSRHDIQEAFEQIRDFKGTRTTVRKHSKEFLNTLRLLESKGVPVCYLFLHGHDTKGSPNGERFRLIQEEVFKALDKSGMLLHKAIADEGDIRHALPEVLNKLKSTSWVQVSEDTRE